MNLIKIHSVQSSEFSTEKIYKAIEHAIASLFIDEIITQRVNIKDHNDILSTKREHLAVHVADGSKFLVFTFQAHKIWRMFSVREYGKKESILGGKDSFLGLKLSDFQSSYTADLLLLHENLARRCILNTLDKLLEEHGQRPYFVKTKGIERVKQSEPV